MAVDKPRPGAQRRSSRPSTRRPRSGGGRPWTLVIWVLVLLLLITAAGWFWLSRQGGALDLAGEADVEMTGANDVRAGDRAVRVVFPEWDGAGFVIEQRRVISHDRPDEDLRAIMASLCTGPKVSGSISALPEGTKVLGAFINPDDQSMVLDFSRELVTRHPGGSLAETATLTSILRTVALNFPGTRSCMILIDGAPVGTLGGHLDLSHSFDPRRWL